MFIDKKPSTARAIFLSAWADMKIKLKPSSRISELWKGKNWVLTLLSCWMNQPWSLSLCIYCAMIINFIIIYPFWNISTCKKSILTILQNLFSTSEETSRLLLFIFLFQDIFRICHSNVTSLFLLNYSPKIAWFPGLVSP